MYMYFFSTYSVLLSFFFKYLFKPTGYTEMVVQSLGPVVIKTKVDIPVSTS